MIVKLGLASMCLAAAASAFAATSRIPDGAMLVGPESWQPAADVGTRADAILAAIARDEAESALAQLHALPDPLRFEPVAARVIDALTSASPTRAARRVLDALAREPVRLYRRHEETAGDWFVPLYDVPGRADAALRALDFIAARERITTRLRIAPDEVLDGAAQAPLVLADAIARSDDATVAAFAAAALARDAGVPGVVWAALARRRPQPDVLQATLRHAEPLHLLPLLQELPPRLAPADALAWLEPALQRDEYASAALLALGQLAPRSPAADVMLLKRLGSARDGASVAAALARDSRPDRVARIDALLAKPQASAVVADLALALKLEGSDAAKARLHRLLQDPRLPPRAKAELQR
jgi:hypothetical protein